VTAEVDFHPDGLRYVVRYDYEPELVGLAKQLPSFARRWQPEDKSWRVATPYANRLAYGTGAHGCLITGPEPEPGTNPTRERRTQ
jgi:hypothetical protein